MAENHKRAGVAALKRRIARMAKGDAQAGAEARAALAKSQEQTGAAALGRALARSSEALLAISKQGRRA
jgi:hypothetical protein